MGPLGPLEPHYGCAHDFFFFFPSLLSRGRLLVNYIHTSISIPLSLSPPVVSQSIFHYPSSEKPTTSEFETYLPPPVKQEGQESKKLD